MKKLNYRNLNDLISAVRRGISIIDNDYDLVIAIPRSGIIPAAHIALLKHLPIATVDGFLAGEILGNGYRLSERPDLSTIKKVLVVDDSVHSGRQISKVKALLHGFPSNCSFTYAAVFASQEGSDKVDCYFELVEESRIFEWNILNSWVYAKSCVDLDGVLCVDPTDHENDDGPEYIKFMKNVRTLHSPDHYVNHIVTSRLEKYRSETEAWLNSNKIKYYKLTMLDLPDGATRRRLRVHALHKAAIYWDDDSLLFIESSLWQAREIHSLTGKPVFCVDTHQMIDWPIGRLRKLRNLVKIYAYKLSLNW